MSALLIARDDGGWQDRRRAYRVMLDDAEVGRVRRGQRLSIATTPGRHEVQLKVDWCRSRSLAVTVQYDDTVELRCWPNAKPWATIFYITLGRAQYIGLALRADEVSP